MAELLVYRKSHWMDALTAEQVNGLAPVNLEKYQSRYVAGDVVEVQSDGFWYGVSARGYRKDAFKLVRESTHSKASLQYLVRPIEDADGNILRARQYLVDVDLDDGDPLFVADIDELIVEKIIG